MNLKVTDWCKNHAKARPNIDQIEDLNGVKEACIGREDANLNGDDRNWPDLKGRERELEKEGEDGNGVKEACDGREEGNLKRDDGNCPDLKGRKRELQTEGEDGNSVRRGSGRGSSTRKRWRRSGRGRGERRREWLED